MKSTTPSARVARGATALFAKNLVGVPLGLLYFSLLARLVSPPEMGTLTILLFVSSIATTLGTLGLPYASARFIPELLGRSEPSKAARLYRKILTISLILSIFIAIALLISAPWLGIFLTHNPNCELLMRLVALSIPFTILANVSLSLVQALQRMKEYAGIGFVQTNTGRYLGLAILAIGIGLPGIFYGTIAAGALAILLSMVVAKKNFAGSETDAGSFPTARLLAFSAPMLGVALVNLALAWADRAFIWIHLPLSDLGVYQVAADASSFLSLLPLALSTALYPQLSTLYSRHGASVLSEAFKTTSRYLAFTFVPMVFGVIVLSPQVVAILASPHYSGASTPLMFMSFGALTLGFATVIDFNLMTLSKTRAVLGVTLTALAPYLMLLLLLVPRLGMTGAAVSKAILGAVTLLTGVWFIKKHIPIQFDKEALCKSATSSFLASIALTPFVHLNSAPTLLPIYLALYAVVYILGLVASRSIHDRDVDRFEDLLPERIRFVAAFLRRWAR